MIGTVLDIEEKTQINENFRQVLVTSPHSQLVIMSLLPNEDIGIEVHDTANQFLRIESGEGKAILNGQEFQLKEGSAVVVPAGTQHNIVNSSTQNKMKLYTIYSPAEHKDGVVHKTKADAIADTQDHI